MSLSRTLASGLPLEHEGVTYWMVPATWRMLGQLEALFAGEALARIERTRPGADSDAYQARLQAVFKLIEKGEYDHGGPAAQKSLATRKGLAKLAWLMLRDQPPHPALAQVEEIVRARPEDLAARVKHLNRPAPERPRREGRPRDPVPFETLAAVLCAEPLLLSIDQVADLTPYQTSQVLFHTRDSKGNVRLSGSKDECNGAAGQNLLEVFLAGWQLQGLSAEEIDRRWEQMVDRMAGIAQ